MYVSFIGFRAVLPVTAMEGHVTMVTVLDIQYFIIAINAITPKYYI